MEMDDDIKAALADGGRHGHAHSAVKGDGRKRDGYFFTLYDLIVVGLYRDHAEKPSSAGLEYLVQLGGDHGARVD